MSAERAVIPLCVPELAGREAEYLADCVTTGWVSSLGPYVDRFERELAAYVGARHAVATASGTAALHVALLLAGVRPDDEVLVSALTFIAPANAVRYAGAWPVFVDAEPEYWQLDLKLVRNFLEEGCERHDGVLRNRRTGRRIGALLPVHVLGHPIDAGPLVELARAHGLPVIEDSTEALGTLCRGKHAGTFGEVGTFSFNGNKIMTTGGGGMIVTDRDDWARRARYLTTQAKDDPVEYIHGEIGFNYRLTNVQAALGCAQLERMPAFLDAKRRIAARYDAAFAGVGGLTPMRAAPWAASTSWMYTVLIDEGPFGCSSRELLARLDRLWIQTRPLWQPLHRSRAHPGATALGGAVAEDLCRRSLSLPCSTGLAAADQERVIAAVLRRGEP